MTQLFSFLSAWLAEHKRSDEGATMVEYGLMVALIAVVCIGSVQALGVSVNNMFSSVATTLAGA